MKLQDLISINVLAPICTSSHMEGTQLNPYNHLNVI